MSRDNYSFLLDDIGNSKLKLLLECKKLLQESGNIDLALDVFSELIKMEVGHLNASLNLDGNDGDFFKVWMQSDREFMFRVGEVLEKYHLLNAKISNLMNDRLSQTGEFNVIDNEMGRALNLDYSLMGEEEKDFGNFSR